MDWNVKSALEQIQKCDFECEAGPLGNNVAFMWLSGVIKGGPKFYPGQTVYYAVSYSNESTKASISRWEKFQVHTVKMSSTSESSTWEYDLTNDAPSAYHYGSVGFKSVKEKELRETNPDPATTS